MRSLCYHSPSYAIHILSICYRYSNICYQFRINLLWIRYAEHILMRYQRAVKTLPICCQHAINTPLFYVIAVLWTLRFAIHSLLKITHVLRTLHELLMHTTVQSICHQYAINALWILNQFAAKMLWKRNQHAHKLIYWCAMTMLATRYCSDHDLLLICYAAVPCNY